MPFGMTNGDDLWEPLDPEKLKAGIEYFKKHGPIVISTTELTKVECPFCGSWFTAIHECTLTQGRDDD